MLDPLLPPADTAEAFAAVRRDDARLRPGVDAILARHGLAGAAVERFADGSLPVYAVGARHALKLYPPVYRCDHDIERPVLERLAGRLPAPAPVVEAAGALDGWTYVLMTRLAGRSLAAAWPDIPPDERPRLMAALGEWIAALHAVDASDLPSLQVDWAAFVEAQRAGCVARQRACGLDERWLALVPEALDAVGATLCRPALLHTELMREHVFAAPGPRGWALTGVLDFEPAMVGEAEYELASVGVFVSCGDAALLRPLLAAYGGPALADDGALRRRVLAYALLHRFSNLAWYLRRVPPGPEVTTLDALAAHFWGT